MLPIWPIDKEEAEERGHRRIRCPYCRYRGWSDDTGHCSYCEVEPEPDAAKEE